MNTDFLVGDIVRSLSGHDKNRLYIVMGIDKFNKIAIIDGRYHEKNKPKTKNPKHLIKIAHSDELLNKVNSQNVTNAEIYRLIKAYQNVKE